MAVQQEFEQTMLQDEECAGFEKLDRQKRLVGVRPALAAIAAVALAATLLFSASSGNTHHSKLHKFSSSEVTMLAEKDGTCAGESYLSLTSCSHNNLGKKGPGTGDEGMVFEGVQHVPGLTDKPIELHINALTAFEPAWVTELGFYGKSNNFMSINLMPGKEVKLKFKVTEPGKSEALQLAKVDLTWFDLDKHGLGNAEYVKANGYQSELTYEGTELEIGEADGWTTYKASTVGTGDDNPTDPLKLTEQQLQRAVTIEYSPFSEAEIVIGSEQSTGETHGRRFDFIAKPSLRCAAGVDMDKVKVKGKDAPQCCIIAVWIIRLACVDPDKKSFYHFMCD